MGAVRWVAVVAVVIASASAAFEVMAQQRGVTRSELQRHDLSVAGREVVQVRVELAPGVAFPQHRHPGEEIIFVLEGSFEYQTEGTPPVTVNAGGVLFIPSGVAHSARNIGTIKASELATYLVEKGQPLVSLVPE